MHGGSKVIVNGAVENARAHGLPEEATDKCGKVACFISRWFWQIRELCI